MPWDRVLCVFLVLPVAYAEVITGHIYCDNQFTFYFNGRLISQDPLDFTPHNAVKVSFEWDGTYPKSYAILCQDYASSSGYEYTSNPAMTQLGDGGLVATFSDGVMTSSAWTHFVVTSGPTAASEAAGCSKTNLTACVVKNNSVPTNWTSRTFDASSWAAAIQYSSLETGWGRAPTWTGSQCCQPSSPLTGSSLASCGVNSAGDVITVTADECLNPQNTELKTKASNNFIWGASLLKDNLVLFRYTVSAGATSTTGASGAGSTRGSAVGVILGAAAFSGWSL